MFKDLTSLEGILSRLSVEQLVIIMLVGFVLGGLMSGLGSLMLKWLMRRELSRWAEVMDTVLAHANDWTHAAEALTRIPGEEWFSEVKVALTGIANQATELAIHTKSILTLEVRIKEIEDHASVDREQFARLRGSHDERMVLGGCGSPTGVERRGAR